MEPLTTGIASGHSWWSYFRLNGRCAYVVTVYTTYTLEAQRRIERRSTVYKTVILATVLQGQMTIYAGSGSSKPRGTLHVLGVPTTC